MLLLATPRVHRTRHIALYRTIVQSAAAVAPLLGGLVVERFEFAPIFVASGIGRLISVLLLLRFVREPRARPASGTKLKRGQTMEIGYLADHPAFIPTLVRWHHAQWSYLRPGDTIERRTARLKGRLGKNQIPTTFVAYDTTEDGREIVVGSASLLLQDLDTRPDLSPWLASVYVDEEYRRQGIGSALVERAAQEAAALKVKTLYLFTPDRQRFYERLGWYEIERCAFGGSMQVVMARDL
jgi:GNAT superfamily N-acetyltransferase